MNKITPRYALHVWNARMGFDAVPFAVPTEPEPDGPYTPIKKKFGFWVAA
jgi:hypothetical protein